jgi:hypothetical protein
MGSGMGRYVAILRFLRKKNWVHIMYEQIENFRAVHATRLNTADRRLLDRYFDSRRPITALRLLMTPMRFRQALVGDVLLRLLLLGSWITGRGLISGSR